MKAEWESSKLAHEATRAEFESYKVRYRVVGFVIVDTEKLVRQQACKW